MELTLADEEPIFTTDGVVHPALANEEMEAEAAVDMGCNNCDKTPCEWLEYGVIAASFCDKFDVSTALENGYVVDQSTGAKVPNQKIGFSFYEKFGHLGRGNRIKIPDCVKQWVKQMFLGLDGNYTNLCGEAEI